VEKLTGIPIFGYSNGAEEKAMNRASNVNATLKRNSKVEEINGLEFEIRAVDLFDMMGLSEKKMGVLYKAKEELGLQPTQSVPKNLRDKYVEKVGIISENNFLNEINEKTIREFVKTIIPKGVVDPKIVDLPDEEIDKDKEVSLSLMLENIDISIELANRILKFSLENSNIFADINKEIAEV